MTGADWLIAAALLTVLAIGSGYVRWRRNQHRGLPVVRWDGRRLEIRAADDADGHVHAVATATGEIVMDEYPAGGPGSGPVVRYGRSVLTNWSVPAGKAASVPLWILAPDKVDRIRVSISAGSSRARHRRVVVAQRRS